MAETREPRVWHRRDSQTPPDAVYIGRPSPWGNPFKIGRDGTRADVIAKYRSYVHVCNLYEQIRHELKGKHLVCWCSPLPCHGDVLLEIANGTGKQKERDDGAVA